MPHPVVLLLLFFDWGCAATSMAPTLDNNQQSTVAPSVVKAPSISDMPTPAPSSNSPSSNAPSILTIAPSSNPPSSNAPSLPTVAPSSNPPSSNAPSIPSSTPSVIPSNAPTFHPTLSSTSLAPSKAPTFSTATPTPAVTPTNKFAPSNAPTPADTPTDNSNMPSHMPSRSPSLPPSFAPNPDGSPSAPTTLAPNGKTPNEPTPGAATGSPTLIPSQQPISPTLPNPPSAAPPSAASPSAASPSAASPSAASPSAAAAPSTSSNNTAALTTGSIRLSRTQGGTIDAGDLRIDAQPDDAWGEGGTLVYHLATFNAFQSANPSVMQTTGLATAVASIDFISDKQGGNGSSSSSNSVPTPIPYLANPLLFQLRLSPDGVSKLQSTVEICRDSQREVISPAPMCVWYDHNESAFVPSGCQAQNVSDGFVQCGCTHLTDFSVILPLYNRLDLQLVLHVDQYALSAHPVGIITLVVFYTLFTLTFFYGKNFDKNDRTNETIKKEKETKWKEALEKKTKKTFWNVYKSQLQKKHTWVSPYFRKKGSSFRSVDRACTTFLLVLIIMSLSATFYGQTQTWVGYGVVIVVTVCVSFVPHFVMETVFTRIGRAGYKDVFELESGVRRVPNTRCCQCWNYYRFPEWFAYVMYAVIFCVAVGLSAYILVMAFQFDSNKEFVCSGKGSGAWIMTVLVSIALNIFVVQPLKILLSTIAIQMSSFGQITPRDTKDMIELHNE